MTEHIVFSSILEIAYLATGLVICVIGKRLLEKGISADFVAEGEVAARRLRIVTASPGLVFLVCGLLIIIVAIYRQTEFKQTSPPTADDYSGGVPRNIYTKIRTSLSSYRLATPSEDKKITDRYYGLSKSSLANRDYSHALEYLTRAVGLAPSVLESAFEDQDFEQIIDNSAFSAFAQARLQIALRAQEEHPLSSEAVTVISSLNIHSLAVPPPKTKDATIAIIGGIPLHEGDEPIDETINHLRSLLKENPRALVAILRNPDYRWLLESEEVLRWLKSGSESFWSDEF